MTQHQDALNAIYTERAQLVAALSKLFPASLETDPNEPDWPICTIDLPTGQATWHVNPTDLHHFTHLPRNQGRTWDGHDTPTKYQRLNALPHHTATLTPRHITIQGHIIPTDPK